jgi:hypothetical protein
MLYQNEHIKRMRRMKKAHCEKTPIENERVLGAYGEGHKF